jgi:hypothetical protein
MSTDTSVTDSLPRRERRFQATQRPTITLPDGRILKPRARIAADLGVSERTIRRMNADTVFIGNVAYITEKSVLEIITGTIKRKNQPPRTRRRRA